VTRSFVVRANDAPTDADCAVSEAGRWLLLQAVTDWRLTGPPACLQRGGSRPVRSLAPCRAAANFSPKFAAVQADTAAAAQPPLLLLLLLLVAGVMVPPLAGGWNSQVVLLCSTERRLAAAADSTGRRVSRAAAAAADTDRLGPR